MRLVITMDVSDEQIVNKETLIGSFSTEPHHALAAMGLMVKMKIASNVRAHEDQKTTNPEA